MKRFLAAPIMALALLTAGCAGDLGKIGTALQIATVGVENPLTKREYNIALRAYKAVLGPTVAYIELRSCNPGEGELASWATRAPCTDYGRKLAAQDALRLASQYRTQMRDFVRNNRMVDARVAYNELARVVETMRSYRKGVNP